MLNDARSLWTSVVTALTEDEGNENEAIIEEERNEAVRELDIYKRMLEESQMALVEMSKVSRISLAEKDAELNLYRKSEKYADIDAKILNNARMLAEKTVLQDDLKEMEMKLVSLMQEKNEIEVHNEMYDEVKRQLVELKTEFASSLGEGKVKDNTRSETIESLAQEYSTLASEYELFQMQSEARIAEITRENEVLVTKMHVLELSISELADREAFKTTPPTTTTGGGLGEVDAQLHLQLKESRSRIINLQYDLKEKEKELDKLKSDYTRLSSAKESVITKIETVVDNTADIKIKSLEDTISILQKDILVLQAENQESKNASHILVESHAKLVEELRAKEALENSPLSPFRQTLQAEIAKYKSEAMALQDDLKSAKNKLDSLSAAVAQSKVREAEILAELSSATARASELKTALEESTKLGEASSAFARQSRSEASVLSAQFAEQEVQLLALRDELDSWQQREAISSLGVHEQQAATETVIVRLESQISDLTTQMSALAGEKQAEEVSFRADLSRLEEGHKKDLQDITIELTAQHDQDKAAALSTLREELSAVSSSQIAQLQKQLATAHEEELNKLHAEYEATIQLRDERLKEQTTVAEQHLADLRLELMNQHEAAINELVSAHKEEVETKLAALRMELEAVALDQVIAAEEVLTAALTAAHEETLQTQRREDERKQQVKMQALIAEKAAEYQQALERANIAHQIAMAELERRTQQEVTDLQARYAEDLARVEASRAATEMQLQETMANLDRLVKKAVARAEQLKDEERNLAIATLRKDMQGLVDTAVAEKEEYFALYSKEREQRKIIHNKLLEIQGNIRVICRARPVLDMERRSGTGGDVDVTEFHSDDVLSIQRDPQTKTKFEFDRVFAQNSTQEEIFAAVQPLTVSVLDGYNVCIFAYGQTGSGKTWTMEGSRDNAGVAPRAVTELFRNIYALAESGDYEYTVRFSMLEIYNESIRDLLDASNSDKKEKLDIRQTAEGINIVQGLIEEDVESSDRVADLMAIGQSNRAVGSHDMNEHSSRSHSILTLTCRGKNLRDGSSTFGKLHLIDLAGSERLSKTDATGDRLKEAQNINRSLSALGDVINALGNKKATHVPYRNSKLTFLLQDSLGGNSKVLMFVNISPAVYNLGETLCSLNFASRCRSVELGQAKKQVDDVATKRKSLVGGGSIGGGVDAGLAGGSSSNNSYSGSSTSSSVTPSPQTTRVRASLGPGVGFSSSTSSSSSTFRKL